VLEETTDFGARPIRWDIKVVTHATRARREVLRCPGSDIQGRGLCFVGYRNKKMYDLVYVYDDVFPLHQAWKC